MKVSVLLESRQANWGELERLCNYLEGVSRRKIPAETAGRFAALYRSVCADLALADAYQLPPGMIHYLHQLVGRAHNQLYRAGTFQLATWYQELFVQVPQRLFADNCLRLAFVLFWTVFLLSMGTAYYSPRYTEQVMGKDMITALEDSFSEKITWKHTAMQGANFGFYIFNNPSIGLRCFAMGLVFGFGGLYQLIFNGSLLGASFGHMAAVEQREHFFHFVTAHGPFELTAVVLMAAAGMRLGFSLIETGGLSRGDALRKAGEVAMPTVCAGILMFVMAALIEAFVSLSAVPYGIKAAVAVISSALLMWYFVILGFPRNEET